MLIGVNSFVGANLLQSAIPPTESDFDFFEMCGSFDLDELNGLNTLLTETEIFDLVTEQEFGTLTMFLGHFEDSLNLGNFQQGDLPITHWNILRREVGTTSFTLLATLPNTAVTNYLDIRAQSGQEYEYAGQSVSNGIKGQLLISEEVSMDFWGWSLTSLDYDAETSTGTQYIFDVEINSDSINLNRSRAEFDNFSKYKQISRGKQSFDSGGLTTFPLTCNNDSIIEPNNAILNELKNFIENGEEKILKNGSGQQWLVDTHTFNWKYRDLLTNNFTANKNEQPYDVSFDWLEIGEVIE